jgi:hypothetical protein
LRIVSAYLRLSPPLTHRLHAGARRRLEWTWRHWAPLLFHLRVSAYAWGPVQAGHLLHASCTWVGCRGGACAHNARSFKTKTRLQASSVWPWWRHGRLAVAAPDRLRPLRYLVRRPGRSWPQSLARCHLPFFNSPLWGHHSDALRLRLHLSVGAARASRQGQEGTPWSVLAGSS